MNKNIKEIKDALESQFNGIKFAGLESINGEKVPCYYDGISLNSLAPKDTTCEIVYFRHVNSDSITNVDLGGCSKMPIINYNFKLVYFSRPKKTNTLFIAQRLYKSLQDFNVQIKSIEENQGRILDSETNIKKNITLKNCTYISIDFTVSFVLDMCDVENC